MTRSFTPPSGYVPCACRDCFEIAIGKLGALCHQCEDAGCPGDRECQAAEAYGGEAEAPEGEPLPPPAMLRELCETQGFFLVTTDTYHPATIIARLLAALLQLDAATHARLTAPNGLLASIPAEATADEHHAYWDADGHDALAEVMLALEAAGPPGFVFTCDGHAAHRLGFFRS